MNKNKHISTLTLFAAGLLSSIPFATSIKWQLDNFQCEADPFDDIEITILCDGTTSCTFEDTAVVAGTLTAIDDFPNSHVTVKACAVNICPDAYTKKVGKLCDWLRPLDDQTCGEIGDYEIDDEIKLPKEENVPTGTTMLSNLVTVKIEIGEDDECESSIGTLMSTYQMPSISLTHNRASSSSGGGGGSNGINSSNNNAARHPTPTMWFMLSLFALVVATSLYTAGNRRRQRREDELLGDDRTPATRYAKC